jgi:hypothetical protein
MTVRTVLALALVCPLHGYAQQDSLGQSYREGVVFWYGRTPEIITVTTNHDSISEGLVKTIAFTPDSSNRIRSIYYGCYISGRQSAFGLQVADDEVTAEMTCSHPFDYTLSTYVLTLKGKPLRIVEADAQGNTITVHKYSWFKRLFCKRVHSLEYFHLFQVFYWDAFIATSPKLLYWCDETIPGEVERPKWVRKTGSAGTLPRCLFKE